MREKYHYSSDLQKLYLQYVDTEEKEVTAIKEMNKELSISRYHRHTQCHQTL